MNTSHESNQSSRICEQNATNWSEKSYKIIDTTINGHLIWNIIDIIPNDLQNMAEERVVEVPWSFEGPDPPICGGYKLTTPMVLRFSRQLWHLPLSLGCFDSWPYHLWWFLLMNIDNLVAYTCAAYYWLTFLAASSFAFMGVSWVWANSGLIDWLSATYRMGPVLVSPAFSSCSLSDARTVSTWHWGTWVIFLMVGWALGLQW